jgi:hypothetical protein
MKKLKADKLEEWLAEHPFDDEDYLYPTRE